MMKVYMIWQMGVKGPLAVFDAYSEAKKYLRQCELLEVKGIEILAYEVHDNFDRFLSPREDSP